MELTIPTHERIDYQTPIVGVGNFTIEEPPRESDGEFACNINRDVVTDKFRLWNYVINTGILTPEYDGPKKTKYEAILLLKDKTIFAYQNFKFDNKPLKLRWYQDLLLSDTGKRILYCASNQSGKEQPHSALVLTVNGYKTMGEIKRGEYVFGSDGEPCKILQTFEQGIKPVYKLTFSDGSVAECGLEHLWKVQLPKNRFKANFNGKYKRHTTSELGKWDVVNLKYLIEKFGFNPSPSNRCIIPVTKPIKFPKVDLPLDPYILGAMLGDGDMKYNYLSGITSADTFIIDEIKKRLPKGLNIHKVKAKYKYNFTANKTHLKHKLCKEIGLGKQGSLDKSIPKKYLYSSVTQRLDLLKGLMDTDGTIGKCSSVEFYSISKQLAEDVRFLVNSLGGKAKITIKPSGYKNQKGVFIKCNDCYRVVIYMNEVNPFHLPRKAEKHYVTRYRKERVLRTITFDRYEQSKCLLVDNEDHTYLTNECIVTHNSLALDVDAATNFCIDHEKEWVGILVSKSLPQSSYQMDRIKHLLRTSNISYKEENTPETKTGKKDNTFQLTYTFYNDDGTPKYTNRLICCPPTGSALGYPADVMWLDEFDFWENVNQRQFIKQTAIPRTFETKGAIKIFTNPNGRDRELYHLWNEKYEVGKKKGQRVWHCYQFNYWDTPGANQDDFDENSAGMSPFELDSTLLARFGRTTGQLFSMEEIRDQYDDELSQKGDSAGYDRETAWFLDVAAINDQASLIGGYLEPNPDNENIPIIKAFWIHKYPVGYPLARVIGVDNAIKSDDGWEDYVEDNAPVKEILADYAEKDLDEQGKVIKSYQPLFGFDITGNQGMLPLIQSVDIEAVDVTFSGPWKWKMYQRYLYYTQMRLFKRGKDRDGNAVNGSDFAYQASKLIVTKAKNQSYRKVHHENERDLDDTQDAVIGLIYLIENPDLPSLSFEIISHDGRVITEEVLDEYQDLKDEHEELKGQYIPSFYDKGEFESWMDQKDKEKT